MMNTKRKVTHINNMRNQKEFEYLKNVDEREVLVKDFKKKEIRNENV